MSFLARLIERHRADAAPSLSLLEPRIASRFEPVGDAQEPGVRLEDATVEPARPVEPPPPAQPLTPHGRAREVTLVAPPDSHVSALTSALRAARSTVEAPALAIEPTTASPPTPRPRDTSPSRPEHDAVVPPPVAHTAPRERARRPVLDVPDAQPARRGPSVARDTREIGASASGAGPTIHVSIGRVDVRAIVTAPAPAPRPTASVTRPSLEDYLRGRQRGGR